MKKLDKCLLLPSLRVQCRVINALVLREIIGRYGRHNIGFLWLIFEPLLFTTGVTILWSLTGMSHGDVIPITGFALTGYSSVLLWRNMTGRCNDAINNNLALLYHSNVCVIDVYLSRIYLELIGATASFIFLGLFYLVIGWLKAPVDLMEVIFAWALLAWFGAALALTLGAMNARHELIERFWHPVSYLLFPLSGSAYMVHWLPSSFQKVVLWLPMVNAVELLREGYFGPVTYAHYDVMYLITFNIVLTLLGLLQVGITANNLALK